MSVGDGPLTGDETRPVAQDAPFLPDASTASGLEDSGRVRTPGTGVQAARDEMVAEVARALGYAGVSPFEIEDFRIEDVADRLRRAGYRRVVEDDTTVERVARALFGDFDGVVDGMTFDEAREQTREAYRDRARAAVRALREDT